MIRNSKTSKNTGVNDFLDFIKRNWIVITGLLIAVPYLKRYLDDQKTAIKNNQSDNILKETEKTTEVIKEIKVIQNANPNSQNARRRKITGSSELWAASTKLAHDFGFTYSDTGGWLDRLNPRGWTENDASIRNTLLKYRNYFPILEKLYYEIDTNSRNLRKDINELLDDKELILVRNGLKI
jgi:hypothetical protein